jgi:hypothetical protein
MIIHGEKIINGSLENVWNISTDVNNWPSWDPHEEAAHINGEFKVGTTGTSKPRGGPAAKWILTKVEVNKVWSLINKMPIGTLKVENIYTELPENKVKCERIIIISGLLVILFWLHFRKETLKDMQATWVALEEEIKKQK